MTIPSSILPASLEVFFLQAALMHLFTPSLRPADRPPVTSANAPLLTPPPPLSNPILTFPQHTVLLNKSTGLLLFQGCSCTTDACSHLSRVMRKHKTTVMPMLVATTSCMPSCCIQLPCLLPYQLLVSSFQSRFQSRNVYFNSETSSPHWKSK